MFTPTHVRIWGDDISKIKTEKMYDHEWIAWQDDLGLEAYGGTKALATKRLRILIEKRQKLK